MAKVQVKYLVEMEQTIDWPDDKMDDFNYDNVVWNCEPDDSTVVNHNFELQQVVVDGKPHEF